jgi:hypothetical protein
MYASYNESTGLFVSLPPHEGKDMVSSFNIMLSYMRETHYSFVFSMSQPYMEKHNLSHPRVIAFYVSDNHISLIIPYSDTYVRRRKIAYTDLYLLPIVDIPEAVDYKSIRTFSKLVIEDYLESKIDEGKLLDYTLETANS